MNAPQRVPQQRALAPSSPAPLQLTDDLSLSQLGQVFTKSGYFSGVRDEAQAIVKILYGRELGISPVTAMMGIHIINSKPAPSADLMAVLIKRSGRYNYKVEHLDNDGCTIAFFENGERIGESTFTRADAQAAQLLGSDTWKKYFRNMAFARALSNGARWFCPDVFGLAVYVPEELGAQVDGDGNVIDVAPTPPPAARPARTTPAKPAPDTSFRERLNQPVPIRADAPERAFNEHMAGFNPVIEDAINAGVIREVPFIDVAAEPLKHDDLAEEPQIDRYDDLPDPPRPDAKFYDYDGDLPLWVVGPLVCYERLVNNKPVLASVVYCAEHQKPFALRLTAANTAGWAHTTVQGQICNQYPVATISNPRTGEVLYDAGDQFPLDG